MTTALWETLNTVADIWMGIIILLVIVLACCAVRWLSR